MGPFVPKNILCIGGTLSGTNFVKEHTLEGTNVPQKDTLAGLAYVHVTVMVNIIT